MKLGAAPRLGPARPGSVPFANEGNRYQDPEASMCRAAHCDCLGLIPVDCCYGRVTERGSARAFYWSNSYTEGGTDGNANDVAAVDGGRGGGDGCRPGGD